MKKPKFPKASKSLPVDRALAEGPPSAFHNHMAKELTSPELAAFTVVWNASKSLQADERLDLPAFTAELRAQAAAVTAGDMSRPEAMLIGQATSLQALFSSLVNRAHGAEYMPQLETYMRLALKAQSQCRATLETLASIKSPPVVYAQQANIAHGPQQVNNGPGPRENGIEQTQQSEASHELLPHARVPSLEGRANPALEAVGVLNRA